MIWGQESFASKDVIFPCFTGYSKPDNCCLIREAPLLPTDQDGTCYSSSTLFHAPVDRVVYDEPDMLLQD